VIPESVLDTPGLVPVRVSDTPGLVPGFGGLGLGVRGALDKGGSASAASALKVNP